jgi:hypothetical protein
VANVTVSFGSDTKSNDAITAGWIHSAMEDQERAGQPVCATVQIQGGDINITLAVGQCGTSGGGGRRPTASEQEVFDLLHRLHLDQLTFSPGELEAFVKQALRL